MIWLLTFSLIPKISTHLHPITSDDNTSRHKLFRVASPSAVRGILFSFQSKCHTDWYVWQSKAIIHLCAVCSAAFMHGNGFLFHSSIIFWKWQRAPRDAESQSQHITPVCVAAGSHKLYHSCYANTSWTSCSDFYISARLYTLYITGAFLAQTAEH